MNFTGSAAGGVAPYSYSWNFGDGATSTVQNPTHTYSAAGNFSVILTVKDRNSSTASASVTVTVSAGSTYSLSIGAETGAPAPGQGGTTNPSPGNHSFPVGSTAQVSSVPNPDYRFSKWTGDIAETLFFSQQATIIMDKNKSLTATFCTTCGDVNGDLKITPSDAQAAFDIFLGRIRTPTWCEKENADVNSSGTKLEPKVTPADAQAIFRKYLKREELPSDCSGNSRSAATMMEMSQGISNVSLTMDVLSGTLVDDIIYVPIIVDSPFEISAFGLDLEFPSDKLIFLGLDMTADTEKYVQLDANIFFPGSQMEVHETKENFSTLRVGGYKTELTFEPTLKVLVTLLFKTRGDFTPDIKLLITNTYDDIKNAGIRNRVIQPRNKQNDKNVGPKIFDKKY